MSNPLPVLGSDEACAREIDNLYTNYIAPGFGTHEKNISAIITSHVSARTAELKARNAKLVEALEFYANPETYMAIGFFPDKPAGEFMDDFEETHLGFKPGKRARAALTQQGMGEAREGDTQKRRR